MHIETAKKLLNMYLELNPHRHDMGTAIKTVLAELDKQTENYEEGYRQGYNEGYLAGAVELI